MKLSAPKNLRTVIYAESCWHNSDQNGILARAARTHVQVTLAKTEMSQPKPRRIPTTKRQKRVYLVLNVEHTHCWRLPPVAVGLVLCCCLHNKIQRFKQSRPERGGCSPLPRILERPATEIVPANPRENTNARTVIEQLSSAIYRLLRHVVSVS